MSKFVKDLDEPLGYRHFLYNVDIEYNPGGRQSQSAGNKQRFKLKYIPYMISYNSDPKDHNPSPKETRRTQCSSRRKSSLSSSQNSSSNNTTCDQSIQDISSDQLTEYGKHYCDDDHYAKPIDVTKADCAFLSNSDPVPNIRAKRKRVVLELISAKLSQSTTFNVPRNSSYTSLSSLSGQSSYAASSSSTSGDGLSSSNAQRQGDLLSASMLISNVDDGHNNTSNNTSGSLHTSTTPSMVSSKRFVSYTILIKTTPGLDKQPGVIERRFSDFLQLYQGLKSRKQHATLVDKYVQFPKKVYLGNYSLTNIAERSIEFTRLLGLCMSEASLTRSAPFVSFLLDKELRDAQKLSLLGDPDDVLSLIETSYYIEKKLYLSADVARAQTHSEFALSSCDRQPVILKTPSSEDVRQEPNIETASTQDSNDSATDCSSETLNSVTNEHNGNLSSLNQRLLVTFCLLFVTYYRGAMFDELRASVHEFCTLISSQEFVMSLLTTRHSRTIRACLLFLMNMNKGNVIDDERRMWLKQRLEDIDCAYADLSGTSARGGGGATAQRHNGSDAGDIRSNKRANEYDVNATVYRITKGDLTSLLRDSSFCSFQDASGTAASWPAILG